MLFADKSIYIIFCFPKKIGSYAWIIIVRIVGKEPQNITLNFVHHAVQDYPHHFLSNITGIIEILNRLNKKIAPFHLLPERLCL